MMDILIGTMIARIGRRSTGQAALVPRKLGQVPCPLTGLKPRRRQFLAHLRQPAGEKPVGMPARRAAACVQAAGRCQRPPIQLVQRHVQDLLRMQPANLADLGGQIRHDAPCAL